MPENTNSVNRSILFEELEAAGVIDSGDVLTSSRDQEITANQRDRLKGGDGDDHYIGEDGKTETFIFDGRNDNRDEGRHVNVISHFSFNDQDRLRIRLDGGYFQYEDGNNLAQSTDGDQAYFQTARDIADLLLHINRKDGIQEGIGEDLTISPDEIEQQTREKNGKVKGQFRRELKQQQIEGSYVEIIGNHLVINLDDGDGSGETVDKWGNYKTNDVMLVYENFNEQLASQLASEFGFDDAEFAANAGSIKIEDDSGDVLSSGFDDAVFILGNAASTIRINSEQDGGNNPKKINIIYGFDLGADTVIIDNDANYFTGIEGNSFKEFVGKDGIGELIAAASSFEQTGSDLVVELQSEGEESIVIVFSNTDINDITNGGIENIADNVEISSSEGNLLNIEGLSLNDEQFQDENGELIDPATPPNAEENGALYIQATPIALTINPDDASSDLEDADPARDGTQVVVEINLTDATLNRNTVNSLRKFVSQSVLDDYQQAGLGNVLLDLNGEPITQAGWYDFTRKKDEQGKFIGDGAELIYGDNGILQTINLYLTDNRFGDNSININQINDPIVLGYEAEDTGFINEDETESIGGSLKPSDIEGSFSAQINSQGLYGSFSLDEAGQWSYSLDSEAAQSLIDGETVLDVFNAEGVVNGETISETITVTISGNNDAVVITSESQSGDVIEDDPDATIATGAVTFSDLDLNDSHSASFSGTASYGTFDLGAFSGTTDGIGGSQSWSYSLDNTNPAVQALGVGETLSETFTITVADGNGGTASQDVTVTVTGSNDQPVAAAVAINATEDGPTVVGAFTESDADSTDSHTFAITSGGAEDSGSSGGTWTQIGEDIYGEAADDGSGSSVSLSADGSVVAIGAPSNDGNGNNSGQVRLYRNTGNSWTQIGQDIDGEATDDWSGWSVSLSGDGSVVAIGSYRNDGNGSQSGHVRLYRNAGESWTQIGEDIDGEAAGDESGHSVSLSGDGSVVAIGSYRNDGNGSQSGHVRLYRNAGDSWTQIGDDIEGEAAGDESGFSVSLSGDGSVIAIGATRNDGNASQSGHVRLYRNTGDSWTQIGDDIDGEASDDFSGSSVSLSADGNVVAIGAYLNDGNGTDSGHVRLYRNTGDSWSQIGQDIDGEAAFDFSGALGSVSLSANGSVVAIGESGNEGNGNDSGKVRLYRNTGDSWTQIGADIDGEAAFNFSGRAVALSADGSVVAIGAPGNGGNGNNSGHVRLYQLEGGTITSQPAEGSIVNNNDGTFSFDPGSDFQDLAEGETRDVTFSYTATDDSAAENATSDPATATVTVTGSNDDVVITSESQSGAVIEDDPDATIATGAVTFSDLDLNDTHTASFSGTASYGTFALGAISGTTDGIGGSQSWSYSLDNTNPAVQALGVGETLSETFSITVDDGNGGSASQDVSVTISGSNDAVVITSSDQTGSVTEDDPDATITTGAVTFSDLDLNDSHTASANGETAQYGTFALGAISGTTDGIGGSQSWSYSLDNTNPAVQALGVGETLSETFTITVDDGNGGSASQDVSVTVTGTNDQPVAAAVAINATEDGPTVVGAFTETDADSTDSHTFAITSGGSEDSGSSGGTWTQIGEDIDGEAAGDESGTSVALSADGNVVAIGAYLNDGNGLSSGHVRLYRNTGDSWTQIGEDIDGEAAFDSSGWSVSLSADGSVVAISAPFNDGNGTLSGHVRLYQNDNGTWTQIGEDIDAEAAVQSGRSVSLSSDGRTVAIGVPGNNGDDPNAIRSGQVSIYQRNSNGDWEQVGADINGEAAEDSSGFFDGSVSLSADGSTVAIGAYRNDGNGSNSGHVRIYQRNSATNAWEQVGEDIDGEAAGDQSGRSVSLSADGSVVAIGAAFNDGNGSTSGQVRLYRNTGDSWTQIGADIDGEAADDQSGISVSLSADGSVVAIGAPFNDGNGNSSGQVRLYRNTGDSWTQIGADIDGEAADDAFGTSVSLSADGSIVAIGAPFTDSGQVRLYQLEGGTITSQPAEGSIVNNNDGTFSFDPGSDFQDLAEGETRDVTFSYTATDDSGAGNATSDPATATVTVTGSNDAPVINTVASNLSGDVLEAGTTDDGTVIAGTSVVSGQLLATDVDADATQTWSIQGTPSEAYGTFALDANGAWSFTLDNSLPATQALAEDDRNFGFDSEVTETFVVRATDEFGAFDDQKIEVKIKGTNDGPVIMSSDFTGEVTEDGVDDQGNDTPGISEAIGNLTADDLDGSLPPFWSLLGTPSETYGTFELDEFGDWKFTLDNSLPATQALQEDEEVIERFSVRATDEFGAFVDQEILITIRGANDDQSSSAIMLSDITNNSGGFIINGEADGDSSGYAVSSAGDVNGDGFSDLIIGAPDAGSNNDGSGKSYVVFGSNATNTIELSDISAGIGGFAINGEIEGDTTSWQVGSSVSSAGDVNGDGFSDLIIGAPGASANGFNSFSGKSYVVFGSDTTDAVELSDISTGIGGFAINGEAEDDFSGVAVSSAGDVNGDGISDLIIGASSANTGTGKSYVVFGSDSISELLLSDISAGSGAIEGFAINGEADGDSSGYAVSSAGDVNGDGFSDLIIGAPFADANGLNSGKTYVVFGSGTTNSVELSDISAGLGGFVINGEMSDEGFVGGDTSGYAVSSAGDVNGDGLADLIVGARLADPNGSASGKTYVVFGTDATDAIELSDISAGLGGFVINGEALGDRSGSSVSRAGDVNGDGLSDLIIGAAQVNQNAGKTYVVFGSDRTDAIELSTIANGIGGFAINGEADGDSSGFAVSSAGDVNGDGLSDLVIGARNADPNGERSGRSYVVLGSTTGAFSQSLVDELGTSIDNTFNGTAANETFVGAGGNDTFNGNGGADVQYGGVGNDRFNLNASGISALQTDYGFGDNTDRLARIDGGGDLDTLAIDGAGLSFDLTSVANQAAADPDGYSRLNSIEAFDLTGSGNNALSLGSADIDDITGLNWLNSGNASDLGIANASTYSLDTTEQRRQLLINGDSGDQLTVTDGDWSMAGTLVSNGEGMFSTLSAGNYEVWNRDQGIEQLIVNEDISASFIESLLIDGSPVLSIPSDWELF